MSSRPMWKGLLTIGSVGVPVRMFSASDPSKISFNQAHQCTKSVTTKIQTKRWCSHCEKELAQTDISRVFEHAKGQFLEVTDADLAKCEATPSASLTITAIVDKALNPFFIDTTAVLVCDGPAAAEPFETIRGAIGVTYALGTIVLYKRRVPVMLQSCGTGLIVVYLLRTADQALALQGHANDEPAAVVPTRANLRMVNELAQRLYVGTLRYQDFKDDYSTRVQKMLDKKLAKQGKATLVEQLQASVSTRKKKSA